MATTVSLISLAFAVAMTLCLGLLVIRRWRFERTTAADKLAERMVIGSYLKRIGASETSIDNSGIDNSVRLLAVSHLLQLLRGDDRRRLLEIADGDGLIENALRKTRHLGAARRADAIHILEQFGSPRCLRSLTRLMANDASREIRLEAAGALARLGALPGIHDTISLLSLDRIAPNQMHRAIFRSTAERQIQQIRIALDRDIAPLLRALLVDALGWSGDLSALRDLAVGATHEDPAVRSAALRAARQLGHPRAGDWVIPLLHDENEEVRAQAATTCAKLALHLAGPALKELENDPSWWVRLRAGQALTSLGQQTPQVKPEDD